MITLIHHPEGERRLGDLLVENFQKKGRWKTFRAAVAFVKRSGVKHLGKALRSFSAHAVTKISVGIDQGVTSAEGLADLLAAVQPTGEVWVFQNETPTRPTFHPKIYLFSNDAAAECFIGSGNLTEGGLFTNYEAFIHLQLDRNSPNDQNFFVAVERILNEWTDPAPGTVKRLTAKLIEELHENGYVSTEKEIQQKNEIAKNLQHTGKTQSQLKKLFAAVRVKPAARIEVERKLEAQKRRGLEHAIKPRGFVMTLQQTDVGVGQKTKGASKRSPEIFIPLAARAADPIFWGWQKLFQQDKNKPGKWDRHGVRMRMGGQIVAVNMMTWPDKSDFRLRNAAIRDAGVVGDVLRMEKSDRKTGFDYYVEIVPAGSSDFARYLALCTQSVRNSKKKWGYY